LFLFDPTQDQRFRAVCRSTELGGTERRAGRVARQETILIEAAARVRRHSGLHHGSKFDRPMIIVLSKFDEWIHLLDPADDGEPWRSQGNLTGVDVGRIERRSSRLRDILLHYCPETVTAAEAFAQDITYIAVSSLGDRVTLDPGSGLPGIRPKDIQPRWVLVPLLYALSRILPALIPRLVRRSQPTSGQRAAGER
jgi:hypothetical protein